jgi:uncharacterized protein (UPF0335 family)
MTDPKLKSLVERIERLMDERDGIGDDIRDVFTEVKSAGYVPKVLRKVIVRRRMDPAKRAEEDSWQEMYESALDGPTRKALAMAASGATARQIEQETGIDQATVARSVSLKKRRETKPPPKDPETGEIAGAGVLCPACLRDEHAPDCPTLTGEINDGEDTGRTDEGAQEHRPHDGSVGGVRCGPEAEGGDRAGDEGGGDRGDPVASEGVEQGDRQSPLRGGTGTAVTSSPAPAAATFPEVSSREAFTHLDELMAAEDDLAFPAHLDRRVRAPT